MSVIKLSEKDIIRKSSSDKIKLKKEDLSYDTTHILGIEKDYRESSSLINDYITRRNNQEWMSEDDVDSYRSALERYTSSANALRKFGDSNDEDDKKWSEYFTNLSTDIDTASELYGKYKTADSFNAAIKSWEEEEELKALDLDTFKKDVDYYKTQSDNVNNLRSQISALNGEISTLEYAANFSADARAKLGELKNKRTAWEQMLKDAEADGWDARWSEANAKYNRAKYIQDGIKLANDALNAEDFDENSGYVSTHKDGFWDRLTGNEYDATYEYINDVDGMRSQIEHNRDVYASDNAWDDGKSTWEEKGYHLLTDDEKGIYNYYYSTQGKEKAEEYLNSIQESLYSREAQNIFEKLEDNTFLELAFSVEVGLDQFASGTKNLFNTIDNYIPSNAVQQASGKVREDLYDDSVPLWYNFKEGKWDDKILGSSLAQVAYDAGTTFSNMAPSMAVGALSNIIVPGSGEIVGTGLMGASAGGNAYQEALNRGYDKSQARTYSTLVGSSEALLQYALGGISKMGGKLSNGIIQKMVSGIDDGFARFALDFGGKLASEGFEEGLQEVLTPFFENIAFNADNSIADIDWSQVAYSTLLGSLSALGFEGAGTVANHVSYNSALKNEGNRIINNGGVDSLVDLANEMAGVGGETGDMLSKRVSKVNSNNGVNAKTVGRLSEAVNDARIQQNKADIVKALEGKGISSKKAENYANILVAMNDDYFSGKGVLTLGTDAQWKKITGDENAYSVLRSVVTDMDSSVNTRNLQHQLGRQGFKMTEDGKVALTDENKQKILKENYDKQSEGIEAKVAEDGNAKVISTDTVVTVKGLDHIETKVNDEGKNVKVAYLKTVDADGNESVEEWSNVEFGSRTEAVLYETFVGMDIDPAYFDDYIKNFNEADFDASIGEAAVQYALGFRNAYRYGWSNLQNELSGDVYASQLTESVRNTAFNLGKESISKDIEAKQNALDTAVEERKTSGKGKVRTQGELHMEGVKTKKRSARQNAGVGLAKRLTALGIDVYIYESHQNAKGEWVDDRGELADNGFYRASDGSIHIDLNAGANGQGIMVYTLSHELVHWMRDNNPREFKILADLLVKWYGKKGVSVSDLIKQRMAEENLSWDAAYEEVIARSCESFLTDSNIADRILELKNTDMKTWEIIRDKVLKFLDWMRSLFKNVNVESDEGQFFRDMNESIDELYDAFYNALSSASETYQWIGARDVSYFAEAKTTDGDTLFQHRAMEADKAIYRDMLLKHGQMSVMEINSLFNTVDKALDVIKSNLEALDYAWEADIDDRAFSPVKPNSDNLYKVSLDFSTLCRKRILQQLVQTRLQEALNKQLSREESIAIRDELMKIQEEGRQIEIACALCYVESARMKSPAQITKFLENREAVITEFLASKSGGTIKQKIKQAEADARERLGVGNASLKSLPKKVADQIRAAKKQAKKAYQPTAEEQKLIDVAMSMTVSDFTSAEGLESLAKNYPVLFDAYTSYIRNATKSKGIENDTWWRAGDSASIGDTLIANMNRENGLRSQSWSDFQVIHLLDYIAATIELSTRNAREQAYSKVPDYIELMGNTGVMLNMSLIPASVFNGKLEYDGVEGIDYKRSLALRDKYHATAGTICIGMDNGQIKLLLADGTIDYVIPYHKSGMAAHIRKLMHIPDWMDYEDYQSEAELSRQDAEANANKYGVTLLDESDPNYHKHTSFSEWFDLEVAQQITKMENASPSNKAMQKKYGVMYGGYMAMQDAANNYLKLCAERGLAPKFSHENADFTAEENYWKLLIDRKMVDNVTGEIIVQQAIKPIFDEGEVLRILNDELERYPKVKADQEYAVRTVMERFLSGKMNSRLDAGTIASIMQKPVDNVTMTNIVASTKYDGILSAKVDDGTKKSSRKTVATYTEAQYNAFGWASYNNVITAKERETLLSRFADFKHNNHNYPVTRWGEAVIHSTETPGVIIYVRASSTIDVPEITRIVRIEVTDADLVDVEAIQEEVILNEQEQILQPYEAAELIYGEEIFRTHKKRDGISFQEYLSREKGRDSKTSVSGNKGLQDRKGSGRVGNKSGREDDGQVKKSSRRDSTGRELTEAQQEFFKDSKVRDADGNLMPVYHATDDDFNVFKPKGEVYGELYYFAVSKTWSKNYFKETHYHNPKNTKKCYLNITNPLDLRGIDGTSMLGNDWISYFESLGVKLSDEFLEMWSATNKNKKTLTGYYATPAWAIFRYDGLTGLRESLIDAGYDGVVIKDTIRGRTDNTAYIAFDRNQIKNTTNTNPTKDPDIRYSKRQKAPTFYSYMGVVVDGVKQDKLGAASVINMLKGKGVKDEEIKWSGIETWLEGKKSVTKAELQEFIAGSQLQIDEDTLDNKDRPYTEDQQKRLDEYEAKRDEVAKRLADEWKKVTGEEFPIRNAGAGLESAVTNAIIDANLEKKTTSFEGRLLEKLQKDLYKVIDRNDDFGFDYAADALRSIHRHRRDFISYYDMDASDKAVIVKYCNALNAYNELPNSISDEDTDRLRAIAREADPWSRKIREVKHEYNEESAKHMPKWDQYKLDGGKNYREVLFRIPESTYSNKAMYAHWEERHGVLAHARVQDFVDADGNMMLFIEELQSDWHNEGSKKGYIGDEISSADSTEYGEYISRLKPLEERFDSLYKQWLDALGTGREDSIGEKMEKVEDEMDALAKEYGRAIEEHNAVSEAVPDAPFRDTYHEYVMKRLLRMAAEEGYDSIGWTTANTQMGRWNPKRKTNREMGIEDAKNPDAIAFEDGYRIEYDQDIPKFLRKYGKKWGAEVGKTYIHTKQLSMEEEMDNAFIDDMLTDAERERESGTYSVWSMPITDSMKDSVLYEGQVMYSRRNGTSNRSLLANALEGAAQNESEARRLSEYKAKIDLINAEEKKLYETRERIAELSFASGPKDTVAINNLQATATRIANRINTYDKQLLNLEATAPLKAVLEREKAMVKKREKQRTAEAVAKQREKDAETLREVMNRNTESRKRGVESRKRTAVRNKIRQAVRDLNGLLNRGTKERNVKTDLQETVGSALKLANVLFNDDITNEDIVLMGSTMATEEEQKLLDQYKALIEKRDSSTTEEALKAINKISTLNSKLADLFKREKARLNQAKVSEAVDELAKAYAGLKSADKDYVRVYYDEGAYNRLTSLSKDLGGTIMKDMSLAQLEEVYDAYKMIRHIVRESNSLFRMGKTQDLAKTVTAVQDEILSYYKERKNDPRAGVKKIADLIDNFKWNEMKPLTAFETLGSEAYAELFWDAIKAESEWARWMEESKAFLDEQREKAGYKSWDMKSAHEFTLPDGKVFRLTLQDMMSIYAYSKRDQAQEHMTIGGFQFDKNNAYKDKSGKVRVRLGDLYVTDWTTIQNIIAELEKMHDGKVIQYVNAVQSYLTDMGKRGNEVSEILYGIGIFNESAYFPLMSAKDYRSSVEEALNSTQTMVSLKNTGMTKQTVPHASNPIILQGFDDVVVGHIDKMAKYCTHVLAIENLRRVFDSVSADDSGGYVSTKAVIEKVFGEGAKKYFDQYITDLNGGVFMDGAESPTMAMFSKFKGTAVGASLSVIVQQPMAIVRAMDVINPKHFILGKAGKAETKRLYEEIEKYAPVATIKKMGGFDVGSSRTAREYLGTGKDKGIADKVNEAAMWGASEADKLGWGIIWKAVKREVASSGKFKQGSAEFYEACGERFTEVIVRSQVYDSVNSRSGFMRSKNILNKFATSFMGEPTTVVNQAYLALLNVSRAKGKQAKAKAAGKLGRTMGVLIASILLTTVAKSFIYAMRDDDDDEALLERWANQVGGNLGFWGDLNPLTMLPYARDLVSVFEGFDVDRPDMTLIVNAINSAKRLMDGEATVEDAVKFIGDAGNMLGVPVKNIIRDSEAIINFFGDITDNIKPTDMGGAFARGIAGEEQSKGEALYSAIERGDSAKREVIEDTYKDESTYESAVKKALRENDPRIREALKIRVTEGVNEKYHSIREEIINEGKFEQSIVNDALKAEYNYFMGKIEDAADLLKDGDKEASDAIIRDLKKKYKGTFTQDDILKAVKKRAGLLK